MSTDRQSCLFSPYRLRALELANRIAVSPMCQYSAVDGTAQPWHWFHVGGLATSGAGLAILEATAVEAIGRISPDCLGLYSDANEAALTALVRDVRRYPGTSRLGVQLAHAGRKASTRKTWELHKGAPLPREEGGWDVVGPSPLAFADGWAVPSELDRAGMTRIRDAFVDATRRASRCGFDLVELHAAHGYLLHEFLSPVTNRREDEYGGDLRGRLRFVLEVVAAVRAAWPDDRPLGVRMTGSDWLDGGLTEDDAVVVAAALRDAGVDYVTPSAGNIAPGVRYPEAKPGYMTHFARRVRAEAGIPTMAVGMIIDAHQAEQITSDGTADLVAIARAFLDDPRWAWHAAAALGCDIARPPQYARVDPKIWPAYRTIHGGDIAPDAGAMGHAKRD